MRAAATPGVRADERDRVNQIVRPSAIPGSNRADPPTHGDIVYPSAIPFLLVHLACFAAIWTGVTWPAVALGIGLYWLRIFAIGAGYHRYFSHRAFRTSRSFQFVLAVLAQSTAQKSVLWWAAKHRHHHLHSDTAEDVHSPRQRGFLYAHVGWVFARRNAHTDLDRIADFARYPELRWLHRYPHVPSALLALLCLAIAGWPGLAVGFFWSTVLVYHGTFCINSLAHVRGTKRYVTGDDSRNNWLLAVTTMGEGWHNNHHAYQSSARQGFRWWELDLTFYILKALSWAGLVWDLKSPPAAVRRNERRLGAKVIERAASDLAADLLASLHLPHLPTRHEITARARAMFPDTPSMDDIVARAHAVLEETAGAQPKPAAPGPA